MHSSGTSLESWTSRINEQLKDVLEPPTERFTEITPTEALSISLNANTKWTLIALATLASRDGDDDSAVSEFLQHCHFQALGNWKTGWAYGRATS